MNKLNEITLIDFYNPEIYNILMTNRLTILFAVMLLSISIYAEPLRIGIASIISPEESLALYHDFNKYIEKKLKKNVSTIIKRDYNAMNQMIKENKVDIASICTGAMAYLEDHEVKIVAVPVVNNKHSYRSYIITNRRFQIKSISDLRNRVFAFTDRLSNSGTIYPTFLIINYFKKQPENVLKKIYYTKSHDKSIYLVNKGVVEAAAVDSLIFDFIKRNKPEDVANIDIIFKSPEIISPPIVASSSLDNNLFNKIKTILLEMDKDSEGIKILKYLNIDRFVEADISDFSTIKEMKETIEKFNSKNNSQKLQ